CRLAPPGALDRQHRPGAEFAREEKRLQRSRLSLLRPAGAPEILAIAWDIPPRKRDGAETPDPETQMSYHLVSTDDEAGYRRGHVREKRRVVRSRARLSVKGVASCPSRVVMKWCAGER